MTLFFILLGLAVYWRSPCARQRTTPGGMWVLPAMSPSAAAYLQLWPLCSVCCFCTEGADADGFDARRRRKAIVPGPDYRRPLRGSTLRTGDVAGLSSMTSSLSWLHGFVECGVNRRLAECRLATGSSRPRCRRAP